MTVTHQGREKIDGRCQGVILLKVIECQVISFQAGSLGKGRWRMVEEVLDFEIM